MKKQFFSEENSKVPPLRFFLQNDQNLVCVVSSSDKAGCAVEGINLVRVQNTFHPCCSFLAVPVLWLVSPAIAKSPLPIQPWDQGSDAGLFCYNSCLAQVGVPFSPA